MVPDPFQDVHVLANNAPAESPSITQVQKSPVATFRSRTTLPTRGTLRDRTALESNGEIGPFDRKPFALKELVHRPAQIIRTREDSRERIELDDSLGSST